MASPQQTQRPAPRFNVALSDMDHRDLALLPLRFFLGITYVYAGLQKLADPAYFSKTAPGGVQAQMDAAAHNSPITSIVTTASHHALIFGALIAVGELAVGIGILLGLWTRVAAIGGMVLALSFLLTVSWHTHPYFLGPDSIYLMAFLPFAIAGSGPWTVDAYVSEGLGFGQGYEPADLSRRRFLDTARIAAYIGGIGLLGAGVATAFGRLGQAPVDTAAALGGLGGTTTTGSSATTGDTNPHGTTTTAASGNGGTTTTAASTTTTLSGTAIGNASAVPVGGAARFLDPATGQAAIVVQPTAGQFEACSAICTHQGCTVSYYNGNLECPCHGAIFDPKTGAVLRGPAQQPLQLINIRKASDGTLYVNG